MILMPKARVILLITTAKDSLGKFVLPISETGTRIALLLTNRHEKK